MESARGSRRLTRLQSRRNRIFDATNDDDIQSSGQSENSEPVSRNEPVVVREEQEELARIVSVPEEDNSNEIRSVYGSDGESDVEFIDATDSDSDDLANNEASTSRGQSTSSPAVTNDMNTSGQQSLTYRLSTVAQSMIQSHQSQSPGSNSQQQAIIEIDLEDGNGAEIADHDEVIVVRSVQAQEVVLDQDDDDEEIEILRDNTSNAESVRNENQGLMIVPDIDIVRSGNSGIGENNQADREIGFVPQDEVPRANEVSANSNEDIDNEEEEDEGPPQKMPRLDTSTRSDEDDGCHICYEPYGNSGGHRPCCLICGHIFGKDCIERWVKIQKRCPDCNCKAMPKDIRIIYVKNLRAIDTAELDRMKADIDKLKIEKNKVELSNAQLRCQVQLKNQEMERLKTENNLLRSSSSQNSTEYTPMAGTSTSATSVRVAEQTLSSFTGLKIPKLHLIKNFNIKEGQSRVGAYNEWMNLLVVTHTINSRLFPGGSYGIKKINSLDMKPFQSFPVHQKCIRDLAFSPSQNDLLLTVGLDKKAVLFNCNSNCTVQTFNTTAPVWACCWNSVNQNLFYIGSMSGQVITYDIRAPQEPVGTLCPPSSDRSGVARLKFVPPAYQSQPSNMTGLLIQKLNSVWFTEIFSGTESEPKYHQLPLEGPFMNVDFEPGSRHVLISVRPKTCGNQRIATSHTICTLGKTYSTNEERDLFSCDIVQVIHGGYQEGGVMCRSALFSPQQGQVYVAGNGEATKTVRVWDIANTEQKSLVRINHDVALDFVHGNINETKFLGIVMDKDLDVYDIK